jgi:RNA polymerase sigma factor for flagellar operon FliA
LDDGEQTLWERWRGGRESVARDALILRYSSWARLVARDVYMRVHSLGDAWQDCVQNALIGLLEAIDRFDPDRNVKFETYARHRVRGAVFNGLRTLREGLAPGPRGDAWARDHASALAERTRSLDDGSAPDPLDAFVAITVGLGLGFLLDQESLPGADAPPDAYAALEKEELRASVTEGLGRLDEREQLIITLHYYHHVPFVDIATRLGVTKGRVSQLHKRALDRLRVALGSRVLAEY